MMANVRSHKKLNAPKPKVSQFFCSLPTNSKALIYHLQISPSGIHIVKCSVKLYLPEVHPEQKDVRQLK